MKVIFCFIFNFYLTFCFEKNNRFRCGFDSNNYIPKPAMNIISDDKNPLKTFAYTSFKTFKIVLDLLQFNDELITYNLTDKKTFFTDALNKAIRTLTILLKVKTPLVNYYIPDEHILL